MKRLRQALRWLDDWSEPIYFGAVCLLMLAVLARRLM